MENTKIILTSTVIATLISSIITYTISTNSNKLNYITNERKLWREQIRKIATSIASSNHITIIPLLSELKLHINAYGMMQKKKGTDGSSEFNYLKDDHIWQLITTLEKKNYDSFNANKNKLINYISLLLKYDWDRSKDEVKSSYSLYFLQFLLIFNSIMFFSSINFKGYNLCLIIVSLSIFVNYFSRSDSNIKFVIGIILYNIFIAFNYNMSFSDIPLSCNNYKFTLLIFSTYLISSIYIIYKIKCIYRKKQKNDTNYISCITGLN